MSSLSKKWQTLKNLNWAWAFKYYRKRSRMYVLWYVSKLKKRASWEVNVDGVKVKMTFSHPYHHLFALNLHRQTHEHNLLVMWKKQVMATGGVIFDIGGYNGIFGLIAGKADPKNKVFIFEPDPVNLKHIQDNIAINELKNVVAVGAAVGDTVGTVTFSTHEGGTSGNISKNGGGLTVPCTTIDTFSREQNVKPTLLKLDIEGAEYRALLGAKETLASSGRLDMLLELHYNFLKRFGDDESNIADILNKNNFRAVWLDTCEFNSHYWVLKEGQIAGVTEPAKIAPAI